MKVRLIFGDQLTGDLPSLTDCNKEHDVIVMGEVWNEATHIKHHKKKIAFLFSAMRHFAGHLEQEGYTVAYYVLGEHELHSFTDLARETLDRFEPEGIVLTEPSEYRVLEEVNQWGEYFDTQVEIRKDTRFLCSKEAFAEWAEGRKELTMEYFYREMRKKYGVLMDGDEPEGGKWNYDAANRKSPREGLTPPAPLAFTPDRTTREVIKLVEERFSDHFGDIEPFYFAVTREQAQKVLDRFIAERLVLFGDYQDAMMQGEAWMYHAHISFYLNCGLLSPREAIKRAERAYREEGAPLNAVEGFIRQILGWREFIRGVYWLYMPDYASENFFDAQRDLPSFYWDADTRMNCLKQCVEETKRHAYAHHIQRLMVLGNFALLAGLDPKQVNEWYSIVYADAYEWVELPNVSGMALYADGGVLATKPYGSSGSYINRMSDYCKKCSYKVSKKNGMDACPFNYLYWNFLIHNREHLESNQRMAMMYSMLDRMDATKQERIQSDAAAFLQSLQI